MARYTCWVQKSGSTCGKMAACSPLPDATASLQRAMNSSGAPPAPTQLGTVTISSSGTNERALHGQTVAGQPGLAKWVAGDWTIRLEVGGFSGNANINWARAYICRVNTSCTSIATIASKIGIGATLSSVGVYSTVVTASSDHVGDPTDTIYIIWGLRTTSGSAESVQLAMRTQQDSPLGIAEPMEVAFTGSAALTATMTRVRQMAVAFAGSAALAAVLTRVRQMAVAIVGAAVLAAVLTRIRRMAAVFTGSAALTATLTRIRRMAVAFAGSGALEALLRCVSMARRYLARAEAVLPWRWMRAESVEPRASAGAWVAPEVMLEAARASEALGRAVSPAEVLGAAVLAHVEGAASPAPEPSEAESPGSGAEGAGAPGAGAEPSQAVSPGGP